MDFKEGLKLALQSLWANKLRTVVDAAWGGDRGWRA